MKHLIIISLMSALLPLNALAQEWVNEYERLLVAYVTQSGVDYEAWHKSEDDLNALKGVVEAIGETNASEFSRERKLAFYINAYNAWMLHLVLKDYPIDSVKDIGWLPFSVFKRDNIVINGQDVSLDYLEKTLLLKKIGEPLIHVGVNCASRGCPPLRSEPYRVDVVMTQLQEQAKIFVNSVHGSRIDDTERVIYVSSLFDWYENDFQSVGGVRGFVEKYHEKTIPESYDLKYMGYDWTLNDIK